MIETIDNFENIEQIIIECDHCGEELTKLSYYSSIYLFGVIFLHSATDGYFGITCPNEICNKTILKRYNIRNINDLKNHLFSAEYWNIPRFKYRSFPYNFFYHPEIKAGSYIEDKYVLNDDVCKIKVSPITLR